MLGSAGFVSLTAASVPIAIEDGFSVPCSSNQRLPVPDFASVVVFAVGLEATFSLVSLVFGDSLSSCCTGVGVSIATRTVCTPGPFASAGRRTCQPGMIRSGLVSRRPSGCSLFLLRS
jgi:hypothetical protein